MNPHIDRLFDELCWLLQQEMNNHGMHPTQARLRKIVSTRWGDVQLDLDANPPPPRRDDRPPHRPPNPSVSFDADYHPSQDRDVRHIAKKIERSIVDQMMGKIVNDPQAIIDQLDQLKDGKPTEEKPAFERINVNQLSGPKK